MPSCSIPSRRRNSDRPAAVISPAPAGLWRAGFRPARVHGRSPEVRGRVVAGETRTPLPGVTITIEERATVAVTDENGAFVIAAPAKRPFTSGRPRPGSCRFASR